MGGQKEMTDIFVVNTRFLIENNSVRNTTKFGILVLSLTMLGTGPAVLDHNDATFEV